MTVNELIGALGAEALVLADKDAKITGGYCGDLLSWVMGRASEGEVWITIMTNLNVVAVASLVGVSAILLTESVEVGDDVVEKAKEQGINLLRTDKSSFETAALVKSLI